MLFIAKYPFEARFLSITTRFAASIQAALLKLAVILPRYSFGFARTDTLGVPKIPND